MVHKAFFAIAHGTGFPACITADTPTRLFPKISPAFRCGHLLKCADIGGSVRKRGFLDRISCEDVRLLWSPVGAGLTNRVKILIPVQRCLKILSRYYDIVLFFNGPKDFPFDRFLDLSSIHHPTAGDPDEIDRMVPESLFKTKGGYRSGITPLDDKTHFEPVKLVEVGGKIILAEGVPDQQVSLSGFPDKDRRSPKGKGALAKSDDEVHLFLIEKISCYVFESLLNHWHKMINSKSENRNSKQISISNDRNPKHVLNI
jgi:hypothetical protein